MIVKTETGKEYKYVGTTFQKDRDAVSAIAYLKEKGYPADMVAISMRMLMEKKDK